jgi:ABC-type polysaccharide/polyol phosphate transport system ATPase subunit
MPAAIEMNDVYKRYRVYRERYRSFKEIMIHRRLGVWEDRWALRGLTLDVEPGRTIGLVGPNGAGKSTTLKLMARILSPDRGSVAVRGRASGLIELGAGFQPEYTGRENVYLNASLLGLTRSDTRRRFDDIVSFSELADHIDAPLRTYSTGMYMRLGFAVAIHVDPEVLLIDEVLAVGDAAFQRKCFDWLESFQRRGGTLVIVSHDLSAIREHCDVAAWIGDGRLLELGDPATVIGDYLEAVSEHAAAAAEATAERRDATGPLPAAQIVDVKLLDRGGEEVKELRSGDPLSVEIVYHCHRQVSNPVLGVALFRNDGAYVYGTNSSVDGLALPPAIGPGRVRLDYRALPLLAGSYALSVAIFDGPDTPALDHRNQRHPFRVLGKSGEHGVIRLQHDWSLLGERAATPRVGRGA